MPAADAELEDELPVVGALRALSVFGADQSGAYREHYAEVAAVLGEDVRTRLGDFVLNWVDDTVPGLLILTGNAGTGKTAVAQAYCQRGGGRLPVSEDLAEVSPGRWVIKDLSGLPTPTARTAAMIQAIGLAPTSQVLVCANEGILRDALPTLGSAELRGALDTALRQGAARVGWITVVNVNRQRPTADRLWLQLLDYVTNPDLWQGCAGCPLGEGACAMRSNAEALRVDEVREQLRTLVRLATGEAVPTFREILAILSWAIVGGQSCSEVKRRARDLGKDGSTATDGYFGRVVGGGLNRETIERSPLLSGLRRAGLGDVSDLEIDGWLRDTTGALERVRALAGDPSVLDGTSEEGRRHGPLAGSLSPLDRLRTNQGAMTFHALGEMVSTDEDPTRVEDGLEALVSTTGALQSGQALWRQRVFFEASVELGGPAAASRRLLDFRHLPELATLAQRTAWGQDTVLELTEIVRGLNFLVTGFSSPNEGLVVPDPACLFARDPGSFRPARPSLVHSQIPIEELLLDVPDRGLVEKVVDIDHVDVDLHVRSHVGVSLRIRPRMYEAVREAAAYQGPVGQGVAEMNDLRGFYGRLASTPPIDATLRVADPDSSPPALVRVGLPHFTKRGE